MNMFLWILISVLTIGINAFQVWFIPWMTKRKVTSFIDDLSDDVKQEFIDALVKAVTPGVVGAIDMDKIVDAVVKKLDDIDLECIIKKVTVQADKAVEGLKQYVSHLDASSIMTDLKDKMIKSAMGNMSGDKKINAQLDKMATEDILSNSEVGSFLMLFPQMKNYLKENPQGVRNFALNWLPRLEAMRTRSAMMKKAATRSVTVPQGEQRNALMEIIKEKVIG